MHDCSKVGSNEGLLSGPFDADCSQTWKALEKSRSYNEMAFRGILDTY